MSEHCNKEADYALHMGLVLFDADTCSQAQQSSTAMIVHSTDDFYCLGPAHLSTSTAGDQVIARHCPAAAL